jgi:spermidine/putrescine transport system substrate-binding protein
MMKKVMYGLSVFALLLAACQQPGAAPTATSAAAAPTAATTSGVPTDDNPCGDKSQLSKELQLYTWVEYIDPDLKERFEADCGVKVTETNYDSNETLLATLQSGAVGYDIIVPSDYMVQILISEDMLIPLDYSLIPNYKNMGKAHVGQYFDPEQKYVAPYFWGTSGFAVDTNALPNAEASWKTVFEPSPEVCGKISMLDDPRETVGAALMYLGYPINDTDPAHLEEAKNVLIEQSKCVKAYDSQSNDDLIVQGETVVGHIWTGDAILAGLPDAGGREGIVYMIPEEGCTIWQDNMAIPNGAPNVYTAHIFINYLNDARRAAQNAEFVGYGTPNEASKAFIDPEMLANPGIYPPAETFEHLQWIEDVGDALELYDRIWTEFKAAVGG